MAEKVLKMNLATKCAAEFYKNVDNTTTNLEQNIDSYITDLSIEFKRLSKSLIKLHALTFFGACIILTSNFPGISIDSNIANITLKELPVQIIAVVTASAYGFYCLNFFSSILLLSSISTILRHNGISSWQYYIARKDGSILWTTIFDQKDVNYTTRIVQFSISKLPILIQIIHGLVIVSSCISAAWSSFDSGSTLLTLAGIMSFTISILSLLSLTLSLTHKF